MKTYRYKDRNGNWVKSIYPKSSKKIEAISDIMVFIALCFFVLWLFITT